MDLGKPVAVAGATVTTFLVVGAATIEAVTAAVGGDIGPGIVGVFVGAVAGLAAAVAVTWRWEGLARGARSLLLGYAAFGLTLLALAALSYVNAPGVDAYLGFWPNLAVAAVVALAAGGLASRRGPRGSPAALD